MRSLLSLFLFLTVAAWAAPEVTCWEGYLRLDQGRGFLAIRNQQEYADFVARIPTQRLQMKQPAPPSPDPLLLKPEVDFDRYALVAIWSSSVHIDCKIQSTERDGEDLIVNTAYDAPSDYRNYASPSGFGQYHLIRVDTFPGQIRIGAINKKAPERP